MDKEVTVASVDVKETRNGNKRFVLRDSEGNEFHEQERNGFTNVYLDAIEPLQGAGGEDHDAEDQAVPGAGRLGHP